MAHKTLLWSAATFVLLLSAASAGAPSNRFSFEGDGIVHLVTPRMRAAGPIRYRTPGGIYPDSARQKIDQIFGVSAGGSEAIAVRLVALLDYLQDRLKGGPIKVVSGYRSPIYNESLRSRGRLAAQTSLHIEGMAADIEMDRVGAKTLWEFVRSLNCCGAGYYHANLVHVDVGPTRSWDETTTGVGQNLGSQNKLVILRTEWDIYQPGENVRMVLGRITDYPIGVNRNAQLVDGRRLRADVRLENGRTDCILIPDRRAQRSLSFTMPREIAPTRGSRVRISFCQSGFPEMPGAIESNPIGIH